MLPKVELGFRSLDARWMRLSWRRGLMLSNLKFEAWIPKLGCEVDATKPAWMFDAIKVRSLDSELGFRRRACDEASVKVNWESDAIAYSNEVRCTKFTGTEIRGFQSNSNLR